MGKARVEADNGKRKVVIDNGDGLMLSPKEYFQKYSETESGKKLLRESINVGSGSFGFNSGNTGKITGAQLDNMPAKDRASFFEKGGQIV